ncbi:putative murein peptide carboxypeptidase [compost metagenome]
MSHWKFIQENDIVDLISPGYPSPAHEIEGSCQFLVNWNLQPRLPKGLIRPHFLHANEDQQRFAILKAAIEAPDSTTIWCLRGGYGSNRLVPMLAKMKKPKQQKLVIGFSDVCSLHTFFIQEWGWKVIHGPVLDRMGRNDMPPKYVKELHRILFGAQKETEFKGLKALNEPAKKLKSIKSKVVGGNLTVLQSTLGTPWQIDLKNSLLFIEDWGERGYRIDRIFEQFRQGGLFKKCHGIVLGDFLGGKEPSTGKDNFDLVWKRWGKDLEIPLFKGMQAGHGNIQRAVPFNTPCELRQSAGKGSLIISTGGRP